jgi:hypothetical protein
VKLPARVVKCPNCGLRFSADSDVLIFMGLGILLGFMLVLVLCPPANAQEHRVFVVPFHNVNDLILLDVKVGGKQATFLLDTGSTITLFRHVAHDSIGIEPDAACPGCVIFVKAKNFDALGVGRSQELSKAVGNIDGILGENFLRGFRAMRIDYRAQTVTLEE